MLRDLLGGGAREQRRDRVGVVPVLRREASLDVARLRHVVVHPPADLDRRDQEQREEAELQRLARVAFQGHRVSAAGPLWCRGRDREEGRPQRLGEPLDVALRVRERQEPDLERRRRERDSLLEQRVEHDSVDFGRVRLERLGRARRGLRVPRDPEHRAEPAEARLELRRRLREHGADGLL